MELDSGAEVLGMNNKIFAKLEICLKLTIFAEEDISNKRFSSLHLHKKSSIFSLISK